MRIVGENDTREHDGPLNIEIDHGDEMLEITITHDRVYFDRHSPDGDHQFSYRETRDILNKLEEEPYG